MPAPSPIPPTNIDPTTAYPRAIWPITRPTPRVARIKDRLIRNERQIDIERARYTTQSYQRTEGQPMSIRRATMLLDLVRNMSITIEPDEIIVGNRSLLPRMGIIAPEGAVDWIDRELDILPTRPQDRFNITPEQIGELRTAIFPYWRGKTLEDTVAQRVPPDIAKVVRGKAFSLNQTDHAQGHILPDVEGWLHLGIRGPARPRRRRTPTPCATNPSATGLLHRIPPRLAGRKRVHAALCRASPANWPKPATTCSARPN